MNSAICSLLVICPELSLTGYYPGDLLDEPAFLQRVEANLLMRNYAGFLTGGEESSSPRLRGA